MRISKETRQDIVDAIVAKNINWEGRLSEPDFLARLFDVHNMPSHDYRFNSAYRDIIQHRINNNDWELDWVFYDPRFNILHADDDVFLRFLCEMLHPVVRPDVEEVERLRQLFNQSLMNDGYQLIERTRLSGRPVFAARLVEDITPTAVQSAKETFQSLDAAYVTQQITRMEAALTDDPDLALGTAKELLETCCKTILRERGTSPSDSLDLPQLVKLTAQSIELVLPELPQTKKATGSLRRLLGSLATIVQTVSELRNEYGTGHGREANSIGLAPRHAKLAVSVASALAVFLLETHREVPSNATLRSKTGEA